MLMAVASANQVRNSFTRQATNANRKKGGGEFRGTEPDVESNSLATRYSTPSSPAGDRSAVTADTTKVRGEGHLDAATDAREGLVITLESAGLPPDGLWDYDAVYGRRFCSTHGQTEYLLGTADTWIRPDDIDIPNAEFTLKARLEKWKKGLPMFDPFSRRCQAECQGTLYSHMYAVVDAREIENRTEYKLKWRTCFTPEGNIPDKAQVAALLERSDRNRCCRRSKRLRNSSERMEEYYRKLMLVINVE